ncbi:hypothetical protein ACHHYP_17228 [Achlya hypogyna]|uniref:LicD/FKTN/FKRP nucleotidyltransferase domain-containing protein n=1 Tax=Achlya hypogyna TaxID=1202772 RepID=A0A1V9Y4Y3_ACHHY|nr:hypothetical protein ACHHYP_17228 [Achlya hypogyna]
MVKRHTKPGACYSREDIQEMIRNLVYNYTAIMEVHDLDYWLDSGTLLGSYRSQGLIPHDVDADVGMTTESLDVLRHLNVSVPAVYELQILNSTIHYNGGDANIPGRFIDRRSGFYIDIFEFLSSQRPQRVEGTNAFRSVDMLGPIKSVCWWGCAKCKVRGEFIVPRDWIYPLQRCQFDDREAWCPAKPKEYLTILYGDNFMIPNVHRRLRAQV